MGFLAMLQDDIADVFLNSGEFAETVTYTPTGGSPTSILAAVDRAEDSADPDEEGHDRVRRARVFISTADIASPHVDDELSFDSLTWAVVSIAELEGGMATLIVEATSEYEKSAEEYRT